MADESGLSLFDDAASAAGSFPRARKGYDTEVVDDYVIALEDAVNQLRRKNHQLEADLADAKDKSANAKPDVESLGRHASTIMHGAELRADETAANADRQRTEILISSVGEARQIVDRGRAEAQDVKMTALSEVQELRERLERMSAEQLEQARGDAARIIDNASNRAHMILAEANNAAATAREGARIEAENLRQRAAREASQLRLAAETAREELLDKLADEHAEAASTTAALMADADHQSAVSSERIEANVAEAIRVRNDALSDAEVVKARAARVSEQEVQRAREQSEASMRMAEEKFVERQREIQADTEALNVRKRAILSQLANLSQLATSTAADFPDDDLPDEESHHADSESSGVQQADAEPAENGDDSEMTLVHRHVEDQPQEGDEPTLVDQPAVAGATAVPSPRKGR